MRVAEIGRKAGLRYFYAVNLPGEVGDLENTRCPDCHELLVEGYGYLITDYRVTPDGRCPRCVNKFPDGGIEADLHFLRSLRVLRSRVQAVQSERDRG